MVWLFVPGLEGLNSDSESLLENNIELYVTLSGKPTARPLSWRGWETRPWMKLLYGTISQPLTASRGVESWISLLRATHASLSQSLANEKESQTSGIYGLKLPELSERFNPALYSSKTCLEQLTFDMDIKPNSKAWATELRRDYSRRLKWGHRIGGSGCSCWPTPRGSENENRTTRHAPSHGNTHGKTLAGEAGNWGTPRANDYKSSDGGEHHRQQLGRQVLQTWKPGEKSSKTIRRLNPLFVEYLMGFPIGMTGLEPVETELSQWLRRWRLQLYSDDSI